MICDNDLSLKYLFKSSKKNLNLSVAFSIVSGVNIVFEVNSGFNQPPSSIDCLWAALFAALNLEREPYLMSPYGWENT